MAVKKIIEVDINTNADEAAKEFDKFGKAVNTANDSVEGLNKTFEEAYGEIQPLTTRMGEAEDRLYELAAAGDTASAEYQGLLTKVGDYRKVQIQTDLAVDAAATTLGQKLGGALSGATAGFAAVQGVMGLVGGESEQLEKALLKVQSALAIQQGVQGIREAIPAFKQFGGVAIKAFKGMTTASKAFALTGIGVVLTAVAALSYALDKLDEQEQKAEEERERRHKNELYRLDQELAKRRKQQQELSNDLDIEQEAREQNVKLLQAQGKDTEEAELEAAIGFIENVEAKGKALAKQFRILDSERKKLTAKEFIGEKGAINKKEQAALLAQMLELKKIQEQAFDNIEVLEAKQATDKRNKQKENYKKARDAARLQQQELERILKEAIDTEIDEEIALQQTLDEIQRENEDRFRTEQENELLLVEEKYDTLEAMAQGNAEALNEIEIAKLNELNDVKLKFADKEVKIDDDKSEKQKQIAKDLEEFKLDTTTKTLGLISGVAELFGKKSEKAAKRAFNVQKAASIALATIETYKGARAIFASTAANPISIANPSAPFIAAGVAVASGLLEVANIASQKFEGGGSTDSGGTSAPSLGGGGAPNFNVVGDSGVNQLATLQQQPTQAYVVSGDVTTAQALDRNRVQNATL